MGRTGAESPMYEVYILYFSAEYLVRIPGGEKSRRNRLDSRIKKWLTWDSPFKSARQYMMMVLIRRGPIFQRAVTICLSLTNFTVHLPQTNPILWM